MLKITNPDMSFKIINSPLQLHLPRANELKKTDYKYQDFPDPNPPLNPPHLVLLFSHLKAIIAYVTFVYLVQLELIVPWEMCQ